MYVVYTCAYVCTYVMSCCGICMYITIRTYVHICTYACTVHMYVRTYIYTYICMYAGKWSKQGRNWNLKLLQSCIRTYVCDVCTVRMFVYWSVASQLAEACGIHSSQMPAWKNEDKIPWRRERPQQHIWNVGQIVFQASIWEHTNRSLLQSM